MKHREAARLQKPIRMYRISPEMASTGMRSLPGRRDQMGEK